MSGPALGGYETFHDVINKYRDLKIYGVFFVSARQNVIRLGVSGVGVTFVSYACNVQRMISIYDTIMALKCYFPFLDLIAN